MPEHIGLILEKKGYTIIHNVFDGEKLVLFKCVTMLGDEVFVKYDSNESCEATSYDSDVHFKSEEAEIIHQEVKKTHIDMVGDDAYGVVFECELGMCQARKKVDMSTESTTWIRNTTKKASSKTNEFIVQTKEKCPRKFPVVLYSEIKNKPMEVALKVRKLATKFMCVRTSDHFCGMKNFDHYLHEVREKWCEVKHKVDTQLTLAIRSLDNIDTDLMVLYCMYWKCKLIDANSCDSKECCMYKEKISKLREVRALTQQFVDKSMCWVKNITGNHECLKEICCSLDTEYPTLCEHFASMFDSCCKCSGTHVGVSFDSSVTVVNDRRLELLMKKGMNAKQLLAEGVTVTQLKAKGFHESEWMMDSKTLAMKMSKAESPAMLLAGGASLEQLNDHSVAAYNPGQITDTFEDEEYVEKFRNTYNSEDFREVLSSIEAQNLTPQDVDMDGSVSAYNN